MNKIILAAFALIAVGAASASAADGRDPSLYSTPATVQAEAAQGQVVEGRNAAVALPTVSDAYINKSVEANARSTR
ncbi:hypothetical protein EV667_1399 [Ancylobacter aquaticus]|uniref:DUF4148 domain-containing protein n=1 Tax=Ancylobacter aquaticus TaxID=100 RepID=A0A4R1IAE9_ANCAQ|nr:hypothetical protein [Ancylobacter aquaticus]TCK31291.1 hypothetical protein EV667_1399 [Ancylobacter aquaticus]